MRFYKRTRFGEGIDLPFSEFKKKYASLLKGYSATEIKDAWKIAVDGNIKPTHKKSGKSNASED